MAENATQQTTDQLLAASAAVSIRSKSVGIVGIVGIRPVGVVDPAIARDSPTRVVASIWLALRLNLGI